MTTRVKIKEATAKLYLSCSVFMGMAMIGVWTQSVSFAVLGVICAIISSHYYASQMKCPLYGASLVANSRAGMGLNYCPSCSRSAEENE